MKERSENKGRVLRMRPLFSVFFVGAKRLDIIPFGEPLTLPSP
jgi:hypothetical protein